MDGSLKSLVWEGFDQYKKQLHEEIFSLVNYGNGFTFSDVYFMPVHLRNYYIKLLVDTKKKEEKAYTNARRGVRGK